MSSLENTFELIHKYLNNELSTVEKSDFEARLGTDKEFAEIFEIQKVSYEIVMERNLMDLKARMQKDLSGKSIGNNNGWKYLGGAGIIVIVVLLYFFFKGEEPRMDQNIKSIPKDTAASIGISIGKDTTVLKENTYDTVAPDRTATKTLSVQVENNFCKDSLVSFSCQSRAACLKQNNGAIEVDLKTVKFGKAPYEFSIYRDHDFISEPVIPELKSGSYNLYVKDAEGCTRRLNVKIDIPSINCK